MDPFVVLFVQEFNNFKGQEGIVKIGKTYIKSHVVIPATPKP